MQSSDVDKFNTAAKYHHWLESGGSPATLLMDELATPQMALRAWRR
jgi:hypothetical protein